MALNSARDFNLRIDPSALPGSLRRIGELTDSSGRCGYREIGEPSYRHPGDHSNRFPPKESEALTAIGLLCRNLAVTERKTTPLMIRAAKILRSRPPIWRPAGGVDLYYWFFGTYALHMIGGPHWEQWIARIDKAIVRTQRHDGHFKGSWDPSGVWGEEGGRVYATAIMTLTLAAYYRYSRLVR